MIIIGEIKRLCVLWKLYENTGSGVLGRVPRWRGKRIKVLEKLWTIYTGLLSSRSDRVFMTHDGSKPDKGDPEGLTV